MLVLRSYCCTVHCVWAAELVKYCSILFADSLSRNSVRPRKEVFKNIEIHVMYRVGRLTKLLALSS